LSFTLQLLKLFLIRADNLGVYLILAVVIGNVPNLLDSDDPILINLTLLPIAIDRPSLRGQDILEVRLEGLEKVEASRI